MSKGESSLPTPHGKAPTPRRDACVAANKTIGAQHAALDDLCCELERELTDLHEECMQDLKAVQVLAQPSETRPNIPDIIRRSTWKTPELRESAAKLVEIILATETEPTISNNDKRWRILEHGCQWVSFTPIGGDTHSFDPRGVAGLTAMRAVADETSKKHLAILHGEIERSKRNLK